MNILNTMIQKPNINLYQPNSQNRQDSRQNIFMPIATTNLIKPDRPQKSYIVNDPFYMAPINFVTDIKENIVNIVKATTGKSNDHDLGRINDVSMKAGALALAGYLFTHGKTSLAKSMEFVGFGAFFASMALWPKLFIEAPLKAMYGLDIHQKYVDNEGRKKMFFQDPQYIPWDLYTDEQLSELGDRLGVPRDIHNRNEVIKKKAHKIALQGNTLWMLTAGFATPLMCALMCNGIEKIVTPRSDRSSFPNNIFGAFASSIEKMRMDKADAYLKNVDLTMAKKVAELNQAELVSYLELKEGDDLSDDVVELIMKKLHKSDDIIESETVRKQIKALLPKTKVVPEVTEDHVDRAWKNISEYKFEGEGLQEVWDKMFSLKELRELSVKDGKQLSVEDFLDALRNKVGVSDEAEFFDDAISDIVKKVNREINDPLNLQKNAIRYIEDKTITREFIEKVIRLDKNLYEHATRLEALNKYQMVYLGDVGDSIAVNRWINTSKAFFDSLGYTKRELKFAKNNGNTAHKLLQTKIETLVADEDKYQEAVRRIQKAILDYDTMFLPDTQDGQFQGVKKTCVELIDDYANKTSKMFAESGFEVMKERVIGNDRTALGSIRENMVDRVVRRSEDLRNGMYKLLYTLDFFKRTSGLSAGNITENEFVKSYKNFDFSAYYPDVLKPKFTEEGLLEDIAKYKKILLEATIADHTTKFGYQNPHKGLYARLMTMLYNSEFDNSTKKALSIVEGAGHKLGETTFAESLRSQMHKVFYNLGNFQYPHAPLVTIEPWKTVGDPLYRDSLLAKKITDFARETASEAYNSSKWLGKFGTLSAVLVGVTLLSQVFFGKIDPKDIQYVRKDNK